MDEPFSALDPLIRDKLQDELLDLQRRIHKTIVFVSHDLDEALKLGNKIAIMEGGRIVQAGTAEDILLRPANAYVAEFVKHMNPLNVLRGTAVMRPAESLTREGDALVLDKNGRVKVKVDTEGRPVGIDLDGRTGLLAKADGEAGVIDDKLAHDCRLHRRAGRPAAEGGDRAQAPHRPADPAGRQSRPAGRPVRRRRDLSRPAAAAGWLMKAGPRATPRTPRSSAPRPSPARSRHTAPG